MFHSLFPFRAPRRQAVVGLILAASGTACRDASVDPMAAIVAPETRGTLALRPELPSLPGLATRAGIDPSADGAVGLWTLSWNDDGTEARELRAEAYRRIAPELGDALGREEARRAVADLGVALEAVGTLAPDSLTPSLRAEVDRATSLYRRAEGSLEDDDLSSTFALTLEASDALRSVAPPAVARSLLARAHRALDEPDGPLADDDRARVERLMEGAEQAVERGEWALAVRRAFYACQLLGLSGR